MQTIIHWTGVAPRLIDAEAKDPTVEIREEPEHRGSTVWIMFDRPEDLLTLADQLAELYEQIGKTASKADPFLPPKGKVAGFISQSKCP